MAGEKRGQGEETPTTKQQSNSAWRRRITMGLNTNEGRRLAEDHNKEATTKTNTTIKQCTREIEGGEDDGGGNGRRTTAKIVTTVVLNRRLALAVARPESGADGVDG